MIQYQENTQTDGGKSNNYNCSIMTFKSQKYRVQCLSDQKLLNRSQDATNHFNSYTHSADFRVSWSKQSCSFLTVSTKNQWNNFKLCWICISVQKISSFHQFLLDIQPILESHDQIGHTHFWPWGYNNFLIKFWFVWIYNMQKIRLFH